MNNSLKDDAISLINEGFSVLPCTVKLKYPCGFNGFTWHDYMNKIPTLELIEKIFKPSHDAICIITGLVSGNFETIDFDMKAKAFPEWQRIIVEKNPILFSKLIIEKSQSGGIHVSYRCEKDIVIQGSQKLALNKEKVWNEEKQKSEDVLIETRGEGGLILVAPSKGYELLQGEYAKISTINKEEHDLLISVAKSLTEKEIKANDKKQQTKKHDLNSDNPFDDYCLRSNFDDFITKHGWQYISSVDGNDYYRRPGKLQGGCSASFDGDIFYIFSSNAHPFDIGRGYNKASVFTMLVCDGDKKRAYKELIDFGYGKKKSEIDMALEVIEREASFNELEINEEKQKEKNKKQIDRKLLDVGGYIGEVMDYTYNNAPSPNKMMSFVGAIALVSYLIGRRYKGINNARSNLFILGLAESGEGKDFPRQTNANILYEAGLSSGVGSKFSSAEGLEDAMAENPCKLYQTDEISGLIKSIKSEKESRFSNLSDQIMIFYSSSSSNVPIRSRANSFPKNTEQKTKVIIQPSLTIFGTAIPKIYYENLSNNMLTGGFFGRSLVFESFGRERPRSLRHKTKEMSLFLPEIAKYFKFGPSMNPALILNEKCDPMQVDYDDSCLDIIDSFNDEVWKIQKENDRAKDVGSQTVWARATENVQKLALIRACSDNYLKPKITQDNILWSIELVKGVINNMIYSLQNIVGDDPVLINCYKIIDKLKATKGGCMRRNDLKRTLNLTSDPFDKAIKNLLDNHDVFLVKIKGEYKSSDGYILKEFHEKNKK